MPRPIGPSGQSANLVLKRVLDLRCYEPVSIGRVVEIRGREVHRARAQVVVALSGTPLPGRSRAWVDSLMQFVQVERVGPARAALGRARGRRRAGTSPRAGRPSATGPGGSWPSGPDPGPVRELSGNRRIRTPSSRQY